jgi:hypothetical protein
MRESRAGRYCEDTTKEGLPCPANARRRPDPDGRHRCPQHTLEPSVREAIQLSRQRAGLITSGTRPADVVFERFQTAEDLDALFDEGLSVLRSELRARKADKARVTGAIATLADAKIRLKSLEFTARALGRLKPGALAEAAS